MIVPGPSRASRTRDIVALLRADRWEQATDANGRAAFTHPTKPGRIALDLSEPTIPASAVRNIFLRANWDW